MKETVNTILYFSPTIYQHLLFGLAWGVIQCRTATDYNPSPILGEGLVVARTHFSPSLELTLTHSSSTTMEQGHTSSSAPSYLAWSIFNTLCCCLPLGIAAIVYSCRAQDLDALGQGAAAQNASKTARNLNVIGLVFGIILIIIVIVLTVLGA
uniref:Uncharacterized protein n=1 Tax=Gadus morhua TaxID=8049 RepID=A0A8C5A0S7_GADMO